MKAKTENGITISLEKDHDNPNNSQIFYNPKMRISRELALIALCTMDKHWDKQGALRCLDACAATGVAGMQWKKNLGSKIEVTLNDLDEKAVWGMENNVQSNGFVIGSASRGFPTQGSMLPKDDKAYPANTKDNESSIDNAIEVTHSNANVIMHQRQFNFVYIDPFGSTVPYMDAAFRNTYHGGVVVLTCTDIAALYGKAPDVAMRNYGAYSTRTDSIKELAARIVLATAAQSAARCNKGLRVLYTVSDAHFVSMGVQMCRGAKHGNTAMSLVHSLLHCLICEEWEVVERTSNPHENVYKLLPCSCYADTPGRTAIQLGPIWTGPIFDKDYIRDMIDFAKELKFNDYSQNLLSTLLEEAECPLRSCKATFQVDKKDTADSALAKESQKVETSESTNRNTASDSNVEQIAGSDNKVQQSTGSDNKVEQSTGSDNKVDQNTGSDNKVEKSTGNRQKIDQSVDDGNQPKNNSNGDGGNSKQIKRTLGDDVSSLPSKKAKIDVGTVLDVKQSKGYRNCDKSGAPMFYYNLHKRRLSKVDIPRIVKVIPLLHSEGYRAARTHFDPMSVRTDASLQQLRDVLSKHCAQK